MDTIGFVGAGNMAEALIKGIISSKLYDPQNIWASDPLAERLQQLTKQYAIQTIADNAALAAKADILILSVKPQTMTEALDSIKNNLNKDALIISIAAGIRTANIASMLGDVAIVRVMPNTPALIAQGASALFANDKAKAVLKKAISIFTSVGKAVTLDNEDSLDAVTAISGSGPAYCFLLIEEMIKAGIELGLDKDTAKDLVLQTAKGAALLAVEADKTGRTAAELRQKVTSPGGTTEAALSHLSQSKFAQSITQAITKARDRSRELSK